jgi:glycosyltransferase involved in cell wall biosynthesis
LFKRLQKAMLYGLATHVIAVSRAASRDAQKVYRISSNKVLKWPYSIPDPGPQKSIPESFQIVVPGRIHPSKGQDVVLRALALLDSMPSTAFIGSGEPIPTDLPVNFLGALPRNELLQHMASAEIVVVPSRSEAFGLVALEAMAVGTPVIASNVGGLAEFLALPYGALVPSDDPAAIAAALSYDLDGAAGRSVFLERFHLTKAVKREAEFLIQLT